MRRTFLMKALAMIVAVALLAVASPARAHLFGHSDERDPLDAGDSGETWEDAAARAMGVADSIADSSPQSGQLLFEDDFVRFRLPAGWYAEGRDGEYLLESDDDDMGSILLLAFDVEVLLEERLASIEEQFLSTGLFELEESQTRTRDGEEVTYQRYRLMMADPEGKDSNSILLHQYVFWRSDVQVLVQLEMVPEREVVEEVFAALYESLEVLKAPEPFYYGDPYEKDAYDEDPFE